MKKNEKCIRVSLIGNPNTGKTTLFNRLTGSAQYVGNWPGVTVEKKEGYIKNIPFFRESNRFARSLFSISVFS